MTPRQREAAANGSTAPEPADPPAERSPSGATNGTESVGAPRATSDGTKRSSQRFNKRRVA